MNMHLLGVQGEIERRKKTGRKHQNYGQCVAFGEKPHSPEKANHNVNLKRKMFHLECCHIACAGVFNCLHTSTAGGMKII